MSESWGIALFMLGLYFFVPIFLGKVVCRGSWREIGIAYGIWVGLLLLFGIVNTASVSWDEAFGWPVIFGMFLTIPAIPILVIVLKIVRVMGRRA
jgi:hypothetical protein